MAAGKLVKYFPQNKDLAPKDYSGDTTIMVSDERAFRHLNLTLDSSPIASSAYQKWPTSNGIIECPRSIK